MEYVGSLPESTPEIRVPFELGRAAMDEYRWNEAIGHFTKATKHASATELVALHWLIGKCHHTPGRMQQALDSMEESARLAEQTGDKPGQAAALDYIGVILRDRLKLDKALEKYEAALKLAQEAGAKPQEASALGNIGNSLVTRGDHEGAVPLLLDEIEILDQIGGGFGSPQAPSILRKCLNAMGRDKFVAACVKAGKSMPEAEKLAEEPASTEEADRLG